MEKLLVDDGAALELTVDVEELKKFMEDVKGQLELFYGSRRSTRGPGRKGLQKKILKVMGKNVAY